MNSNDLSFKEHSLKITLTRTKMVKMCQILNQDKQLLFFFFFFFFFSQTSLGAAVYKWHYKYSLSWQHFKLHLLSWFC